MQFSRNFSGLALFILALTGAGTATPLAAVRDHAFVLILIVHLYPADSLRRTSAHPTTR